VDLFRRHFLKRSDETVARVVDEDIDSTKVIDSVRDDSQFGFLDPTTDTVISPIVTLQRLSARDKKRG